MINYGNFINIESRYAPTIILQYIFVDVLTHPLQQKFRKKKKYPSYC